MTTKNRYLGDLPAGVEKIADDIAVNWKCQEDHAHSTKCLWVWHDCKRVLGSDSMAPGMNFGWTPTGVENHTLVQEYPLTIIGSVYWPECCGLHGFIINGKWLLA